MDILSVLCCCTVWPRAACWCCRPEDCVSAAGMVVHPAASLMLQAHTLMVLPSAPAQVLGLTPVPLVCLQVLPRVLTDWGATKLCFEVDTGGRPARSLLAAAGCTLAGHRRESCCRGGPRCMRIQMHVYRSET